MDKNTIQTQYTFFDFDNIRSNKILVKDIAHALSLMCRYNGHINRFYSVCQHSCFVYHRMKKDGWHEYALHGLLHDAHEAYAQDMVRPLKIFLKTEKNFDFNEYLGEFDDHIFEQLDIDTGGAQGNRIVKYYDDLALWTEKKYLFDSQVFWHEDEEKFPVISKNEFKFFMTKSPHFWATHFVELYKKEKRRLARQRRKNGSTN